MKIFFILGVLSLFIKFSCTAQVLSIESENAPNLFKKKNDFGDEKFDYEHNRHSTGFNFGGSITDDGEYPYFFFGLNYEYRLYDFLGISLNCKAGERYINDNARYEFTEKYEPVFKGTQSFNAKTQAIDIAPKVYLNIWREEGVYLFGEFGSGIYFLKSKGRTTSVDELEYSSSYSSKAMFYYRINIGAEVYFAKRLMAWTAIGGENIDFKAAYNNLAWNAPWVSESLPSSELILSFGLRFYW